ncbi:MAG TPA: ATPase, T2SS/T4P/T4SS family [Longimicrobium sp.]|jgi:type IV pilus assembly protein PilB
MYSEDAFPSAPAGSFRDAPRAAPVPPVVPAHREREGTIQDRIIRPLLEAGDLAAHDVEAAYQAAAADRERRSAVFHLVEMGRITAERALHTLGRVFGVETVSLAAERPHRSVLDLIDSETARQIRVIPLRIQGRDLLVANGDPYDLSSLSRIREITGLSPVPLLADDHSLDTLLRTAYAVADKLHRVMGEAQRSGARVRARASISEEIENAVKGAQVPQMVEAFIEDAVKKRASDVHFEFFDDSGRIRYRIDGQLVVVKELDPTWGREIVNRIKVLAGLNSAQDRTPEDGRMKHTMDGTEVEFRVSTLPTDWGCEHAVLRVLARAETPVDLSRVGMPPREYAAFTEAIDRPQGMILVTGPTGSGKSTTLYAALDHLNDPSRSIITIEDPVERKIRGVRQTSVGANTGMTFATALRSILRQDPNVIMVGEIRDAETAGTAVKASMTGHLLLSTLHTNDAPSTVARMLDIGIEPYNLVDALSLIVAQRLVRQICPRCRDAHHPTEREIARAGLTPDEVATIPFCKGTGCSYCNRSGYFGRQGLFEMMPLTPALREAIVARRPSVELRALAVAEGMTTLRQAGIDRMRAGETTLEEVTRETMG